MTERCLNPACETTVPVIGVCLTCANGRYDPRKDGVRLSFEPYTTGGITKRAEQALSEQLAETTRTFRVLGLGGGEA